MMVIHSHFKITFLLPAGKNVWMFCEGGQKPETKLSTKQSCVFWSFYLKGSVNGVLLHGTVHFYAEILGHKEWFSISTAALNTLRNVTWLHTTQWQSTNMHSENETKALNNLTTPKLCMSIYITMQRQKHPISSMFKLCTNEPLVGHNRCTWHTISMLFRQGNSPK